MIPRPPRLNDYGVTHNRVLRFICSSAVAQNITFQNLLDTILMTTTATAPFDLFFAVRINRIKAWVLPALGSVNEVIILFDGVTAGFVGDRKTHIGTSMGIEPGTVACSPVKDSLASKFQVSSSNVAFNLQCPGGTVIDIDLSFRADTLGNPVQAQNVSVGANVGTIAYRGLDGLASATSKMVPPNGIYTI
jgi:hypothetical protein